MKWLFTFALFILVALDGADEAKAQPPQNRQDIRYMQADTLKVDVIFGVVRRGTVPPAPAGKDTVYGWVYIKDSTLYMRLPDGRIFALSGGAGGGGGSPFVAKQGANQTTDSIRFVNANGVTWTLTGSSLQAGLDTVAVVGTVYALSQKVPNTRSILNGWGILGGGPLSADVTPRVDTGVGKVATKSDLLQFSPLSHTHTTTDITSGIWPLARGGIGVASWTAGNLAIGAGSSPITFLAPGANGGVLYSNSGAFAMGSVAGDLTGAFPNWTIATGAVNSLKLLDGAVSLVDMNSNSVDGGKVVDGSLGLADLGSGSVNSGKVVDQTLTDADVDTTKMATQHDIRFVPILLDTISIRADGDSTAIISNVNITATSRITAGWNNPLATGTILVRKYAGVGFNFYSTDNELIDWLNLVYTLTGY